MSDQEDRGTRDTIDELTGYYGLPKNLARDIATTRSPGAQRAFGPEMTLILGAKETAAAIGVGIEWLTETLGGTGYKVVVRPWTEAEMEEYHLAVQKD